MTMPTQPHSEQSNDFTKLGLILPLLETLKQIGHKRPSEIQEQTIPQILDGKDVLIASQTGSGKTAAFVLPILQKISEYETDYNPKVLILEPTRELAMQTASVCRQLGRRLPLKTRVICGGVPKEQQVKSLSEGVDIIVATHGRLLDLVVQGQIILEDLKFLVLDEADRLLDEDFAESMNALVPYFPDYHPQTVFCSATLPAPVMALAQKVTRNPVRVEVAEETFTPKKIRQRALFVEKDQKIKIVSQLLDTVAGKIIIFVKTKNNVQDVFKILKKKSLHIETLHGDKTQAARSKSLDLFKKNEKSILITTDIASRGLDISDVDLVINMDMPTSPEIYVHRIGRTARAGKKGAAFSLITIEERLLLREIEKHIGFRIRITTEDALNQ
ncbi:DEAD/DEAH box helicase [Swingsia samuiensis]|uniref:DEAD/DEAH box helicase n=1 Tax=Swingsia samuiensis TaxID=1293412 RepID=A0A4Y6ULA8_9PROT|nr:DEAD/DEAH box helicase [Swingsia samuiensis]QDH17854.1 DEAD/DEAH box helicase [Swingsia samuiensis]